MTSRERVLAYSLLGVVGLGGFAFAGHLFVVQPLNFLKQQIAREKKDIDKQEAEIDAEIAAMKKIYKLDPRLESWKKLSLPATKKNSNPEETKKHLSRIQVDYEKFLSTLMRKAGFNTNSVKVTPKPPDDKGVPKLAGGKIPAYTRLAFHATGSGSLESLVRALEEFHKTPLLHQVRSAIVNKPTTGSRERGASDLDVTLVVEALLANGAEEREALMPSQVTPKVLAEPDRTYARTITARNPFFGIAPPRRNDDTPREEKAEVLAAVTLIMITGEERWDGPRLQAVLYDQGKSPQKGARMPPLRLGGEVYEIFTVRDRFDNDVLSGKLVHMDSKTIVFEGGKMVEGVTSSSKKKFESDGKYYQMYCGDFLDAVVNKPLKEKDLEAMGIKLPPKKEEKTSAKDPKDTKTSSEKK